MMGPDPIGLVVIANSKFKIKKIMVSYHIQKKMSSYQLSVL